MLGVVLAGGEAPAAMAVWREIAAALGRRRPDRPVAVPAGLHPTRSATLSPGGEAIGAVGEVAPGRARGRSASPNGWRSSSSTFGVLAAEPKPARWKATSRHPSSDLDLAFVLDEDVPAEKLEKAIRQGAGSLLVGLELFDVYRGAGVADGSRSLAFRLRLQAPDRTLTDADTADVVAQASRVAAESSAPTLRA